MTTILGLSGSLRAGSFNSSLLRAAVAELPAGVRSRSAASKAFRCTTATSRLRRGLPEAVVTLKERIVATDGLLLVTPEYNNSMPGVFKNAIDWFSRPTRISRASSAAGLLVSSALARAGSARCYRKRRGCRC